MDNSMTDSNGYIGSGLWIAVFSIIICAAVAGNILTLLAIVSSRQLASTISNQFIFSLAVSDLLVGLSLPYHMCFYLVESLGQTKSTCVLRFFLICFVCCSSILNLLVIASDRYSAIVHPLKYKKYMSRRISFFIISLIWILSLSSTGVIIFWNSWSEKKECSTRILPFEYFHFVLMPSFVLIWSVMILIYIKIWREVSEHAKRMRNTNLQSCIYINDTKSIQVVMLTLGGFSVCWIPFFIVTSYLRIIGNSNKFTFYYEIAFTLAVANSGMNPIIYAWKNSNFREAFWYILTCRSPNKAIRKTNYITDHVPSSKKNSTVNGSVRGEDNGAIQTDIELEIERRNPGDYDEHECSVSTETTTVNTLSWT